MENLALEKYKKIFEDTKEFLTKDELFLAMQFLKLGKIHNLKKFYDSIIENRSYIIKMRSELFTDSELKLFRIAEINQNVTEILKLYRRIDDCSKNAP